MRKVAVFGNAGGGKSTLSKQVSEIIGIPLYVLDKLQYQAGGVAIPPAEYQRIHEQVLATDRWVIDGFGCMESLWLRLDAADSLVYIDLPLYKHFWWVTKRMLTGSFDPPVGWPENSPIWKSSMNSYRSLWLCHKFLTPKYREYVEKAKTTKNVYHLRSPQEIRDFLMSISSVKP